MTFVYISQIQVNNCYTYQDFAIPAKPLESFKHIVLTGKNGSGKTTILDGVSWELYFVQQEECRNLPKSLVQRFIELGKLPKAESLKASENVRLSFLASNSAIKFTDENIFSFQTILSKQKGL